MWFLFRAGRYAARTGGRNRGPAQQWSGGTKALWFFILGGMALFEGVKHPAIGISALGAVAFVLLFGFLAGRENQAARAGRAAASQKAQRDALDAQMRQWEAEDAARKGARR